MDFFFWKKTKKFISTTGWFEMAIPVEWERYDDIEGVYSFYDPINWKGNFRVTPFQLNKDANDSAIEGIGEKNNAQKIRIGKQECLYYKIEIKSEDEHSIMYNWIF